MRQLSRNIFFSALGALSATGFAPLGLWPLLLICLVAFIAQLRHCQNPLRAVFSFYFGFFATGVSWVYIPIHTFGHLPWLPAGLLTAAFCLFLAGLSALPFWIARSTLGRIPVALSMTLAELIRSVAFTGFPWLLFGYAFVDTPWGKLLPYSGPVGVTFIVVLTAEALVYSRRCPPWRGVLFICFALVGASSIPQWDKSVVASSRPVALLQGNVPQSEKWTDVQAHVALYLQMWQVSEEAALVIMPETAIEIPRPDVDVLLEDIDEVAKMRGQTVFVGLPARISESGIQNRIDALGRGQGQYAKRHLVPFGEYVPFGLRGVIDLFDIPIFDVLPGKDTSIFSTPEGNYLPTICYEIAFTALWRAQLPEATAIVSVVNNAWFGRSWAQAQQWQMVQALAASVARPIYQAGNTGITGLVNASGQVVRTYPAFEQGILTVPQQHNSVLTPFAKWGQAMLWLVMIMLASMLWRYRHHTGKSL